MNNTSEQAPVAAAFVADFSKPISLEEARMRHIHYLEHGPHILTADGQYVHSFSINQNDLELLFKNAKQGIRLHFCEEPTTRTVNIIAVPLDEYGDLNIGDPTTTRPIVNTLEPCPTLCGSVFSENSLNAWPQNGTTYWIDPNNVQEGKIWFTKNDDGSKRYVDIPDGAPTQK